MDTPSGRSRQVPAESESVEGVAHSCGRQWRWTRHQNSCSVWPKISTATCRCGPVTSDSKPVAIPSSLVPQRARMGRWCSAFGWRKMKSRRPWQRSASGCERRVERKRYLRWVLPPLLRICRHSCTHCLTAAVQSGTEFFAAMAGLDSARFRRELRLLSGLPARVLAVLRLHSGRL